MKTTVRASVERQLRLYPASTLKDLYKNFFQDRFGPGHIINNTEAAANYLNSELSSMNESNTEIAEPIGWENNFYRVNLSVVKEGKVPFDIYLDAFVRSINGIKPMPIEEWREEWHKIEKIISSMSLNLPNYDEDLTYIEEQLSKSNYVGHHSEAYKKTYSPHYRIVSREIYENELLLYINQ